jgi:hypothetical protein
VTRKIALPVAAGGVLLVALLQLSSQSVQAADRIEDEVSGVGVMVILPERPVQESLVLEVGARSFAISGAGGGGVAIVRDPAPLYVVRIITVSCRLLVAFEAAPGTAHVVRFANDGSVTVEHIPTLTIELGPALAEGPPVDCGKPGAPATNEPAIEIVGALAAVGLLLLLMLFAFSRQSRRA